MISTLHRNPSPAFLGFARRFIEALAAGDYGAALAGLDMRSRRWSKQELVVLIARVTDGAGVCSARGMARSASPVLESLDGNESFRLTHRLPARGKWTDARAVFAFHRARGDYYSVTLEDITA